jgi:hypothetical protein
VLVTGHDPLEAARDAVARAAWAEARAAYEAAAAEHETAEALEGIGFASLWLWDADGAFRGYERAYRLYRRGDDARGAGRAALWLAVLAYNFRTDAAIGNGWLGRARRLLEGLEAVPERGLVWLLDGHTALLLEHDLEAARRHIEAAEATGRELRDANLEVGARALRGLLLVTQGTIAEGMRLLDEATAPAFAGELTDPFIVTTVPCYLIYACKRVRDYDRAAQ